MSKCRILVVDDNVLSRELFACYFNANGCDANRAEDGIDALLKTSYFNPHVVIWALDKPDVWGFEFLAYIKRHQPSVKVIALAQTKLNRPTLMNNIDKVFGKEQWEPSALLSCIHEWRQCPQPEQRFAL